MNFEPDLKITQLISAEGEVVIMDKPVDPENPGNKGNIDIIIYGLVYIYDLDQ